MPKVTFVTEKKDIEVGVGANLRQEAMKAGVQVYKGLRKVLNCHGLGLCGSCKVLVKKGDRVSTGQLLFLIEETNGAAPKSAPAKPAPAKTEPAFEDMPIKLRRTLTAARFSATRPAQSAPEQINAVLAAWDAAAA